MKTCNECKRDLPLSRFSLNRGKPAGRCKDCHNKYSREIWYKKNKVKQLEANRKWKSNNYAKHTAGRLGVDVAEVENILLVDCCELCGSNKRLVVDHDHITNRVRGRLCSNCNVSIGKLGDTEESILRVVDYLRKRG